MSSEGDTGVSGGPPLGDRASLETGENDSEKSETEHDENADIESSVENSQARPHRNKKLSETGKQSKVSELNLQIGKAVNSVLRFLATTQKALSEGVTLEHLHNVCDELDSNTGNVCEMYNALIALCDSDEEQVSERTKLMYATLISKAEGCKTLICNKIKEQEAEQEEILIQQTEDRSRQLDEEERLFQELLKDVDAALPSTIKITTMKQKQETPPTTTEDDSARITTPAGANTSAERSVIEESDLSNSKPTKNVRQFDNLPEIKIPPPLSPALSETSNSSILTTLIKGFTDALKDTNRKSVEPDKFYGDVLQYSDWEVDLEEYFAAEKITGHHRLRHLKKYLGGEARKCVESHLSSNTTASYDDARNLLKDRYGNEFAITRNFLKKLSDWPIIRTKDYKGLREYSDFLAYLRSAKKSMGQLSILDSPLENEKMAAKLPEWLKLRWPRVVSQKNKIEKRYPNFEEFEEFIKDEADIANLEITQSMTSDKKDRKETADKRSVGSFFAESDGNEPEGEKYCLYCSLTNHDTGDCYKLQNMTKEEREKVIRDKGWCFKCLNPGHRSRSCNNKRQCKICKKGHSTVNHDPNWMPMRVNSANGKYDSAGTTTIDSTTTNQAQQQVLQRPEDKNEPPKELSCRSIGTRGNLSSMLVPVYLSAGTGREILVYAMLDNMSDACYISSNVVQMLQAKPDDIERDVIIHTINGSERVDIERYDRLMLRGYTTSTNAQISAYRRDHVTCKRDQIPDTSRAKEFKHLEKIASEIPPRLDIPIGLLIGADHPEILQPLETKPAPLGATGLPFGVRTLFGWTMGGGSTQKSGKYAFKTETTIELMNLLERDFKDTSNDDQQTSSQDDLKFMEIMHTQTTRSKNGNYIMPLPFRTTTHLPYNRTQAENRLKGIVRKFKTDPSYHNEYKRFMNNLIEQGHVEKAPASAEPGKVWYIPHFSVRHKQKKKLRIVMDASARFNGVSLNDKLISGPDHMNSLIGILMRFRREPIAITCDIEQMFYNFLVREDHRDFLRFLWIDDTLSKTEEYRMNVHLFGATSSPAVATYGLRRIAEDYRSTGPLAADFLQQDFYVDDGVTSVKDAETGKHLIKAAIDICAKANVRLHKFLSNNKEVLNSVPETERAESTKQLNIFQDELSQERTLGMEWCVATDTLHFSSPKPAMHMTKSGVLSTIAQIYDPLGLISPIVLKGKRILQKVTAETTNWDQLLEPEAKLEWQAWLGDLKYLQSLTFQRCYKKMADTAAVELHHFSDASEYGYGACSYIRLRHTDESVTCSLVFSKSRVAPLKKKTTIPRLELQGAVTASKIASVVKKELKLDIEKEMFWTDSKIVLGYIRNESKRFHTYVTNRVAQIRKSTDVIQWQHVRTQDNPADLASRGCAVKKFLENAMWINGPDFLHWPFYNSYIEENRVNATVDDDDKEVRVMQTLSTQTSTNLTSKFDRYSSMDKLVRSIAILKSCARQKTWKMPKITVGDLKNAETFIIQQVQTAAYPDGDRERSLVKLSPIQDNQGLLRIGGRLKNAKDWTYSFKHPIIIPKHAHIANLIIKNQHNRVHHLGYRSTLAAIREAGYWLINGPGAVKKYIGRCVTCKKLRGLPMKQQMGNLPKERLELTAPFSHVGMDVFGPFHVKDHRTERKRWGLIVTCLYSRAVHIEILDQMTTDCLILALRNFMAIRGPVHTIICDNGTNFVGMQNEMDKQLKLADKKLDDYLQRSRITMKFNPPRASHHGGVTERMIRSIRAVMNGLNIKYRMDSTTLRTVFSEVANVVNNRPLTGTAIEDPHERVMTPNILLTGKEGLSAPPPGDFPEEDVYCRKRWIVAQAVTEAFWKAWKAEYLSLLTQRQRWTEKMRNVKVGDIVLLWDDSEARNDWKIARVNSVKPGSDDLVRSVEVVIGNHNLDTKGKPMEPPTKLTRSVNKLILLVES